MQLKLGDQQLKIIVYIYMYRLLYINLMVTTNHTFIIDKHTKESKHNTKDSHQITKEESKRRKEQKRTTNTTPRQLTK